MISRYGYDVVLKFIILAFIIIGSTFTFTNSLIFQYTVVFVMGIAAIFVLYFFRDPDRTLPPGEYLVVSPADGKIVLIKELYESEYLNAEAVQVSIFMSPLNVHVNRFPISGHVEYFKHIPGKFTVAYHDKSSDVNERTLIGIENSGYKILFKQVAGTIARRIVADIKLGQQVTMGKRLGMIKFGSRVDVIMPKNTTISVKLDDRVKAGESVLATYTQVHS